MTLCYLTWGGFFFCLYRRGIDYTRHFLLTTTYFLSAGTLMALVFLPYLIGVVRDFTATPFIVLCIFMLAQIPVYTFLPTRLREPDEYFRRYPDRYYLRLDWRRLISKSADILAQQVFIVLLVTFLRDADLPFYQILAAFGILFMLLHIPLVASERGAWPSWLFAGAVVAFSVVFPTLILEVRYGFVYNYMIHWSFYTLTAVIFWVRRARLPENGTPAISPGV